MWQCHYCRLPLSLEVQRKNHLCPNCGSDLHCCKNCINYDENLSSSCRESNSPWIRDRAVQNHCPFFEHRPTPGSSSSKQPSDEVSTEAERAKEAFRALFRNP